jgi:hypothetical protein
MDWTVISTHDDIPRGVKFWFTNDFSTVCDCYENLIFLPTKMASCEVVY